MGISRRFRAVTASAVVGAVMLAFTASGAASGESSGGIGQQLDGWRGWHHFGGVTVMSPDSALTVGYVEDAACCIAMSQRWDGSHWSYLTPRAGGNSALSDVDSLSDTDAWAVGANNITGGDHALTEHWDGHRWQIVDSGSGSNGVGLSDVSMVTANDVWAVGTYYWGEGGMIPVVMHWDGSTWTRLPNLFAEGTLDTVEAISADDVWATGLYSGGIWHWDGTTWTSFHNPLDGFFSMSAESSSDVWVTGQLGGSGFGHWDGHTWTYVDSPELGAYGGLLTGVTTLSKKDAWAVGYTFANDQSYQPDKAIIEHWDGHKWTVVPCPHSRQPYDMLNAVSASSPDDVWAIGTFGADIVNQHGHRFMLHWDGTTWSRHRN